MSEPVRWFLEESAGAPETLRARAGRYLEGHVGGLETPEVLAAAATEALAAALARPADRGAALDLLAADALITLALKARAVSDPAGLAGFAAGLRHSGARIR